MPKILIFSWKCGAYRFVETNSDSRGPTRDLNQNFFIIFTNYQSYNLNNQHCYILQRIQAQAGNLPTRSLKYISLSRFQWQKLTNVELQFKSISHSKTKNFFNNERTLMFQKLKINLKKKKNNVCNETNDRTPASTPIILSTNLPLNQLFSSNPPVWTALILQGAAAGTRLVFSNERVSLTIGCTDARRAAFHAC